SGENYATPSGVERSFADAYRWSLADARTTGYPTSPLRGLDPRGKVSAYAPRGEGSGERTGYWRLPIRIIPGLASSICRILPLVRQKKIADVRPDEIVSFDWSTDGKSLLLARVPNQHALVQLKNFR
ncbi:MAG TPA: hypothetical protein VNM92_12720, partial [Thermoanaerobaculia bacterium]|nr:hypothetical protein [Thermoanaerobaculia bacterium]